MSSRPSSTAWPTRSPIATFVHSLHLLDLDQRDDWPGIHVQSFSSKSTLQHRLRCVEWALYCLFELYDAKVARDKLRPFFPPATSLQSVNLRAALLRQLTELKKNGILGPQIVLRKTMLDECKGDKFEELLAALSMVVVRKMNLTAKQIPHANNLVPLILSHRRAIQRNLETRKELALKARQQHQNIDETLDRLTVEAARLRKRKLPDLPNESTTPIAALRENWIGDYAWVDAILYSTLPREGHSTHVTSAPSGDEPVNLLSQLQTRVNVQNERLERWQAYLAEVQERDVPDSAPETSSKNSRVSLTMRFTRHRSLNLASETQDSRSVNQALLPHHASLIASLEEEIKRPKTYEPLDHQTTRRPPLTSSIAEPGQTRTGHTRIQTPERSTSFTSDLSSQGTTVVEIETPRAAHPSQEPSWKPSEGEGISATQTPRAAHATMPRTPPENRHLSSLLERTRTSMAQFETPRARDTKPKYPEDMNDMQTKSTITAASTKYSSNRASLLERTRQSMSMLSNALDDSNVSATTVRSKKPGHTRSKTAVDISAQRRKLERAWSEESLASVVSKADLDLNADEELVFKSRPRLAISPNLSPQRTSHDLWLESQLEAGMNKLTIDSSPEL